MLFPKNDAAMAYFKTRDDLPDEYNEGLKAFLRGYYGDPEAALSDLTNQATYTGTFPTLFLPFASTRTLGPLITFTRADATTCATYVDSDRVMKTAAANVARFHHDPATGQSLGFLHEGSRTNSGVRSEELDNATWTKARSSISANQAVAPDGTTSMDKLVEDNTNNTHLATQAITFTSAAWSVSWFLKAGERTSARIVAFDGVTSFAGYFNLSAGTAGTTLNCTSRVDDYGTGIYRCTIMFTAAAGAGNVAIRTAVAENDSYQGDGASGIYAWGCQVEAGSFPSSYIKTAAAAVTRAADSPIITGANFSGFFNAAEGTFVAKGRTINNTPGDFCGVLTVNNDTSAEAMNLRIQNTVSDFGFAVTDGGVSQASLSVAGTHNDGGLHAAAAAYKLNDIRMAVDGTLSTADTSATLPTVTQMKIGSLGTVATPVNIWDGTIAYIAYYNTRLPDETLRKLTLPL